MEFSTTTDQKKGSVHHNTHALPPDPIQEAYWYYNKVKRHDLEADEYIVDFRRGLSEDQQKSWRPAGAIPASQAAAAYTSYSDALLGSRDVFSFHDSQSDIAIYEHQDFPGLQIIPGLLSPEIQTLFVSQIMHRELSDPSHKINLQADYHIPYPVAKRQRPSTDANEAFQDDTAASSNDRRPAEKPASFFTYAQSSESDLLTPKDPSSSQHKPLNMAQFLANKLRWLTIGDQYDWPTRSYGNSNTTFPSDLSKLITGLFPHIRPESGVVLMYSGKDFMPVHRDVSEQCERSLASFSLGCDGVFVIARDENENESEHGAGREEEDDPTVNGDPKHIPPRRRPDRTVVIRVRSGDCIHLSGEARWAWHAMPRTISGTCPKWLSHWPAGTLGASREEEKAYQKWKGYMSGKRINVSCRQVWD